MPALFFIATLLMAAEPPQARLRWAAVGSTCDEAGLRRAVARRLGYDPFVEEASTLVDAAVNGLTGRIIVRRTESESATRTFEGATECRALFDSMSLALAVAIDPLMMTRPAPAKEPEIAPVVPTAVPPAAPVVAASPPSSESPPGPPWRIALLVAGGLEMGAQPAGWLGFRAAFRVSRGHFGALIGPYFLVPSHDAFRSQGAVDAMSAGGDAAACFHIWPVSACAAARVGALRYDARDLTVTNRGWVGTAAVGPRLTFEWPSTTTFGFFSSAELWVPLIRSRMLINNLVVWEQPPVAGSVVAGFTWRGP